MEMLEPKLRFWIKICSVMTYIALNSGSFASNCCSVSTVNRTVVANCSNLNWTFVDLRCVPVTTQVLLLDRNNLTTLTNGSFQTLTSLLQLSIQSSNVHRIEIDTFLGLRQLQNLNLENNKMTDDFASLDPQTFRHFTNLKQLFIGNNENLSQNVKNSFVYLRNLSSLSMDGSKILQIGREFSNLTQLNNLTLYCSKVTNITNESFVGLWNLNLTILNLNSCSRLQFDPQDIDLNYLHTQFSDDAFQNLNSLEVLSIINCRIGNENIARKFKHFINSSLHTLYLEATHYTREYYNPNSTFQDGVIFTSTAKYLRQLTLTHFSWVDSNIFAIQPGVASNLQWRRNIKSLDISNNRLGWVGWRFPLLEVARLEKLETLIITSPSPENKPSSFNPDLALDIMKANLPSALPSFSYVNPHNKQPLTEARTTNTNPDRLDSKKNSVNNSSFTEATTFKALPRIGKRVLLNIDSLYKVVPSVLEPSTVSLYVPLAKVDSISEQDLFRVSINPPFPTDSGTWTIRMPLSLNTVKIVSMLQRDNNYGNQSVRFVQTGSQAANFTHFYFVGNSITRGTGRIMGLANLQLFDLSRNYFMVTPYFFDDFPSLKYLMLQSMMNEDFFQRISIDRIIQNMPELRYLDLTDNKLNFLPPNLFSRNSHITHVILAKNRFSSFPITMDLVPNLKTLDLTGNAIIYLTEEDTKSLTKHSENVSDFYLALAENNIACVCSHIQFMFWLNISDFLDNKVNYACTSQEGQLIVADKLLQDVYGFYRQCYGYNYLLISIVLLLVMSFIFLMAYLMHRFRTAIEASLVRIFIKAFRPMKSSDYKANVFIGYADDDVGFVRHILLKYLEEDLKVSTFVHHRDLASGYTDQQMFEAMSMRVIL